MKDPIRKQWNERHASLQPDKFLWNSIITEPEKWKDASDQDFEEACKWMRGMRLFRADYIKLFGPKSYRRTEEEIWILKFLIFQFFKRNNPESKRHIFYKMEAEGIIEKDDNDYQGVVIDLSCELLWAEIMPWSWVIDDTRLYRKMRSYSDPEQALRNSALTYRKNLWESLPVYVEVLTEKLAIQNIIFEVTSDFDVPLLPLRGEASDVSIRAMWDNINAIGKTAFVYLLLDYDKAGEETENSLRKKLLEFARRDYLKDKANVRPEDIHVIRLAINKGDILKYKLPTRPPNTENERQKGFSQCVELDALSSRDLQLIVRHALYDHLPEDEFNRLKAEEELERKTMQQFIKNFATFKTAR